MTTHTGTDASQKASKKFTLDGEPCDLADFFTVNDIDPETANAIGRMEPGEEMVFGGGAAPEFVLRREA